MIDQNTRNTMTSGKAIALFALINTFGLIAGIYVVEHRELHTVFATPCAADKPIVWEKTASRSVLWDWLLH